MRRPPCEICGSGIEPEEGTFICSGCARPRDQWLAEMARLCALKGELVVALEPFAKYSADYRRSWPNTPAEGYVTHFETMTEIFGIRLQDLDRAAAALAKAEEE